MKIAAFTLALGLALAPAIAAASCSYGDKRAMSCAEGTKYDTKTGTCIAVNA